MGKPTKADEEATIEGIAKVTAASPSTMKLAALVRSELTRHDELTTKLFQLLYPEWFGLHQLPISPEEAAGELQQSMSQLDEAYRAVQSAVTPEWIESPEYQEWHKQESARRAHKPSRR